MQNSNSAKRFYGRVLKIILKESVPFVVGGGYAVFEYTHLNTPTPDDLDIFCKGGDMPKIVSILKNEGVNVSITDERWLAKASTETTHVDLIFSSPNYLITVDDTWFEKGIKAELFDNQIKLIPVEELIWCKAFVQDRGRFDGADINHLILFSGKNLDWKRLLMRMENHWEILLSLLISFRFVYPSERDLIPKWLLEELNNRLTYQIKNPTPKDKICRGPLLSRTQYKLDIAQLGFETIT